jgi:hypothetical protein
MKLSVLGHCLLLLQSAASASSVPGLLRGEKQEDPHNGVAGNSLASSSTAAVATNQDTSGEVCTTIQEIHDGVAGIGSEVLICGASITTVGIVGFVANEIPLSVHESTAPYFIWVTNGLDATDLTTDDVLCRPEKIAQNGTCLVPIFKPARGDSVDIRGYVQQQQQEDEENADLGIHGLSIDIISWAKARVFAPTSPKDIHSDNLRGGSHGKVRTL